MEGKQSESECAKSCPEGPREPLQAPRGPDPEQRAQHEEGREVRRQARQHLDHRVEDEVDHQRQPPAVAVGQAAQEYDQKEATANSRINARLPYIFLASRIAHYLKVIQRENIGTTKDRTKIERELNTWIKTLVIGMKDPSEQQIAKYPLRDAQVKVYDIEENPGFYRVEMMIIIPRSRAMVL